MAGERGSVAVELMDQGAAGGGAAAADAGQTGSRCGNRGQQEGQRKRGQTVNLGSTGTHLPGDSI